MTEPGKIVIDRKVYFEPDGLPKPESKDYSFDVDEGLPLLHYKADMDEYEASKQLIEVINVGEKDRCPKCYSRSSIIFSEKQESWCGYCNLFWFFVKNNQSCKAEVTGTTCTIIELIK